MSKNLSIDSADSQKSLKLTILRNLVYLDIYHETGPSDAFAHSTLTHLMSQTSLSSDDVTLVKSILNSLSKSGVQVSIHSDAGDTWSSVRLHGLVTH